MPRSRSSLAGCANGLALDEVSAERLVGLVLRSRSLVFRYSGKVARRAEILDGVVAKVRLDLGDEAAGSADRRLAVFAVIDEGYAGIRALITALPLATAPRAKATSAYLAYVARTWATLRRKIEETSAEPQFAGGLVVSTSEGQRFDADAMTSLLVNLLGMNATLASYQGGWFDDDGLVRLPDLPVPEDVDVVSAGAADHTALAWQQWQLIEERCRYFGGTLTRMFEAQAKGGSP